MRWLENTKWWTLTPYSLQAIPGYNHGVFDVITSGRQRGLSRRECEQSLAGSRAHKRMEGTQLVHVSVARGSNEEVMSADTFIVNICVGNPNVLLASPLNVRLANWSTILVHFARLTRRSLVDCLVGRRLVVYLLVEDWLINQLNIGWSTGLWIGWLKNTSIDWLIE